MLNDVIVMLIIQIDINNTNFKTEKTRRIVFNMKENTKNQPYKIEIRLTLDESQSNIETDGGPGSGRYPKGSGKRMKRVALRKRNPSPCQ